MNSLKVIRKLQKHFEGTNKNVYLILCELDLRIVEQEPDGNTWRFAISKKFIEHAPCYDAFLLTRALREAWAENERLRKAARNVVADWLDPPKDARNYDYTMEILKQTLEDK